MPHLSLRPHRLGPVCIAALAAIALVACGGGGGSSTPAPSASTLSGTAATGAPISGTVIAIDATGQVSPAVSTDPGSGAFTVNVAGMTAPFILQIVGSANGAPVMLNSIATSVGQTVNITPLTDLVVSTAAGVPGGAALATLCAPTGTPPVVPAECRTALGNATQGTRLNDAVSAVQQIIAPLVTGTAPNPLTVPFSANGSGFDALLDKITVAPATAQGAQATVTLIGVNQPLGSVTLPATAGGTSTGVPVQTAPSQSALDSASQAAAALAEIKVCVSALNALYPTSNFTPPTPAQVDPFIDASVDFGDAPTRSELLTMLTSGQDEFGGGFSLNVQALSRFDMSPFSTAELVSLSAARVAALTDPTLLPFRTVYQARPNGNSPLLRDAAGNITAAWVRVSTPGGDTNDWKYVKGGAYAGCPGGWKFAGPQHVDFHMKPRVSWDLGSDTVRRELPVHIETKHVDAISSKTQRSVNRIVVSNSNNAITVINASGTGVDPAVNSVTLIKSSDPLTLFWIINHPFYNGAESLLSCQDLLSSGRSDLAGVPCFDDTRLAPGNVFSWQFRDNTITPSTSNTVAAIPYTVSGVPLATSFVRANKANLYAQIQSITPASIAAINTARLGFQPDAPLEGVFTVNYVQGTAYGSRTDNCHLQLYSGSTLALAAEQNATGSQTSCTFRTAGLYSGSLANPATAITSGYISVSTHALGNQLSMGRSLP